MKQNKILIICDSDLSREPRVIRQILARKELYQVCTVGEQPTQFADVIHYNYTAAQGGNPRHWNYPMPLRKLVSFSKNLYQKCKGLYTSFYYEREYWDERRTEMFERIKQQRFDIIIAHHWDSLPIAYELSKSNQAKLIFNAHDYYPRQFEENVNWSRHIRPFVNYVMDTYLPKFDFIFSAWTKIHEDFQAKYGVASCIINNATEFNDLAPQLRDNSWNKVRLIHHGIANPNRKIESMIKMLDYLDERFTLDFILVSPPSRAYLDSLIKLAANSPRIRFLDPVPTRDIAKAINSYDIGIFLLPPNGFNPTYLLPNKLFEFVQARLACLVSPSVEMKTIVEKYDLGWVSEDFEPQSLANEIKHITMEELNRKKQNAHKNAYELSANENYQKIRKIIKELLPVHAATEKEVLQ